MSAGPNLASVAALIGESTRAQMLCALLDHRARTASELADCAGITPQTASAHLSKLLYGELVVLEKQGRHRYYRLANERVAAALEALQVVTATKVHRPYLLGPKDKDLRRGRRCYDHLAGELGVNLTQAMVDNNYLIEQHYDFDLTDSGEMFLSELGVDVHLARQKRRKFSPRCIDWSERKAHLAGSLGAAICNRLTELNWVAMSRQNREVKITQLGLSELKKWFNIHL